MDDEIESLLAMLPVLARNPVFRTHAMASSRYHRSQWRLNGGGPLPTLAQFEAILAAIDALECDRGTAESVSTRPPSRQDATKRAPGFRSGKGELMTSQQVADLLGCSTRTVQRRTADGSLRAVHLGRLCRYRRDDILAVAQR